MVEAEATATRVLTDRSDELHALARALLAYEVLDDSEIDKVFAGEPLGRDPVRQLPAERGA